jgi:hypothetical protein
LQLEDYAPLQRAFRSPVTGDICSASKSSRAADQTLPHALSPTAQDRKHVGPDQGLAARVKPLLMHSHANDMPQI